ncbi:DUF4377 domain-containing protein [Sphingobacterium sp. SRCM116780]|uniref:DUF4377 domain-containing protein n=1 Tax=Sphingobacterium sp. SRCM116780 TaxID=2907623 RepID=UPI001F36AD52|nr:DUF4377 domain-containing protein [Sphingobacterium sp. SRCM116780]UIR57139.1 DUF4377 domain-containing protein [Sphingobacterium sp. SRCM116780]
MIKFSTLFLLSLSTISFSSSAQTNTFTIEVKSGVPQQKALQVKYSNSAHWEPFYAAIDHFNYDPNFNYELRVKRTKLENSASHKPNYRYQLVKTIQKSIGKEDQMVLEINDKLVDCTGVGNMKCLQVKYNSKGNWEYFHDGIKDFDYQEGYTYKIIVNRKKVENPPQDASAYVFELVKIVEKKASKKSDSLPTVATFLSKFKWKLISLNGKEVGKYNAYILFDADKGRVSGNSSCNNFFGPFIITNNKITFPNIGSTMRACMGENIETDLYQVLENKDLSYDIAEQTFNLYIKNKHVAIFGLSEK